ncbi:MAG: SDR family oxidoreductase [Parcubacteria group bacterium]
MKKVIFLTGATGFLGGELLVSLSKDERIEKVYCLVRASDKEKAISRLKEEFNLHADNFPKDKIIPIVGDLLDNNLTERLIALPELASVDTIIHAAADTHFTAQKYMEQINVGGVKKILQWAMTLKNLKLFTYIGTATICGKEKRHCEVSENESPNPAVEHMVKYTKTKMLAEMEVRKTIPADKLLVVRPSSIMGDSRKLEPRDFAILWALIAVNELRLIPANPNANIDMLGVDYVAEAIHRLIFAERRYNTYHISSGYKSATSLCELSETVKKLDCSKRPDFRFIDFDEIETMKQWARSISRKKPVENVNGCSQYIEYWQKKLGYNGNLRIILSCLEDYLRFANQDIVFDNSRLLADTGMGFPVPAHEYVSNDWPYMQDIDVMAWALNS